MKGFAIILGVAAWGMFPMSGTPSSAVLEPRPDVAVIVFGADTVVAEVMDTPAERSGGLQFRDNVPDGTGMLFVFQSEAPRSFWMKDTYIALDIAYLDVNFRIVDIQQMEPQTEELHNSAGHGPVEPAALGLGIGVGAQAKVVLDPPGVRIN